MLRLTTLLFFITLYLLAWFSLKCPPPFQAETAEKSLLIKTMINYLNFVDFQTVLDPSFIAVYNLLYTSQPVLALAYFDQDVKPEMAIKVQSSHSSRN